MCLGGQWKDEITNTFRGHYRKPHGVQPGGSPEIEILEKKKRPIMSISTDASGVCRPATKQDEDNTEGRRLK